MSKYSLNNSVEHAFEELSRIRDDYVHKIVPREFGVIMSVSTGTVKISGLPGVGSEELLKFSGDLYGIAFNLDEEEIGVILLGENTGLNAGDEVERTGRVMDVPVGEELIGRVVNPLGEPLDGKQAISSTNRWPIERPATEIVDRAPVTAPLQTGIKVIDTLIPIGRGQRELILGDRQTGKSAIAIDTILNQKDKNVICVYCAIGQRASSVAKVIERLNDRGAMEYTIVVVTEGDNAPGLKYIAPYAATSMAEYFMEQGRDVLIVYDDLTQHARAYRELSLLLKRPPGREAFPGDIFYIHSRLLERSTHLREELKGGSLTAFPVIETEAQNIAAYIPTNLISITDGQLYVSPKLFELGILPAIDIGKSVSRVGGKAQLPVYRSIAGDLKLEYSQFEELESFARFGIRLEENTRRIIEHGKRIRACLIQTESDPISVSEQITLLLVLKKGYLDHIPLDLIPWVETIIRRATDKIPTEVVDRLLSDAGFSNDDKETILRIAENELRLHELLPEAPED